MVEVLYWENDIRGVPLWLLQEYIYELGGTFTGNSRVSGRGWEVLLEPMDDYKVGSLSVGQVHLHLKAEADVYSEIRGAIEKKLLRAGG